LLLHVFPGENRTSTLYEDDGRSFAYQRGQRCKTTFTVSKKGEHWSLLIAKRDGEYAPVRRDFAVVLHGQDEMPNAIRLDGKEVAARDLHYDSASGTVQLTFTDDKKAHELVW
jgi:alpha-glucosidase